MADTRAKMLGGMGALLIAVVAGAITHTLDRYNWEQQHKTERLEYRQLQAEKTFDSVTIYMSRFAADAFSLAIYHNSDAHSVKDSLTKALLLRLQEFEVQRPIADVKIKLYFSDSTYKTFQGTLKKMRYAYIEAESNLGPGPGALKPIVGLTAFQDHMRELATLMEVELADGITSKK
jgi:hypothetical protein